MELVFVFEMCTDVLVEDLRIEDSSEWTLNPRYSQRLVFRRLNITAPTLGSHGHNTDGCDPDCECRPRSPLYDASKNAHLFSTLSHCVRFSHTARFLPAAHRRGVD